MSSLGDSGVELCLPTLLPDSEISAVRSDVTWLVKPGARFKRGDPLAYFRAFHDDIGCRWEFMTSAELQVILGAPADGVMHSISDEQGGWYPMAPLLDWNETRMLGSKATLEGLADKGEPAEVLCSVLRAERYHPYLENRGGGILTSPYRRMDLWTGAPKPAELKLISIGLCDHAALFGETGGEYHKWTGHLRRPTITTKLSDSVHAYSSYSVLQDLTVSAQQRAEHAVEIAELLQAYLSVPDRKQTSQVSMFLSLLLADIENPILSSELKTSAVAAAHDPAPSHRAIVFAMNVDNAVHLRSRATGFTFSILAHRLRAFDRGFQKLLVERFEWIKSTPRETLDNYEQLLPLMSNHGYGTVIANFILPGARTYDYSLVGPFNEVSDCWLREGNSMLRKFCARTGAGLLDSNAVLSRHGSKDLIDTVHHNSSVLALMRSALTESLQSVGVPNEFFVSPEGN